MFKKLKVSARDKLSSCRARTIHTMHAAAKQRQLIAVYIVHYMCTNESNIFHSGRHREVGSRPVWSKSGRKCEDLSARQTKWKGERVRVRVCVCIDFSFLSGRKSLLLHSHDFFLCRPAWKTRTFRSYIHKQKYIDRQAILRFSFILTRHARSTRACSIIGSEGQEES